MEEKDRRKHPRFECEINVFGLNGCIGIARNISVGGCYFETKDKMDNTFNISLGLPNSIEWIKTQCNVMWSNNNGIGTKFNLDQESRRTLSHWISRKNKGKSI